MKLSFDGHGLNDAEEKYTVRIATLTDKAKNSELGEKIERRVNMYPVLLRELKSAIHYISVYGGDVTSNFASSGNLDAILRIIEEADRAA